MTATIRIFVVDDHPLVREWLGGLLRLQPDFEVCGESEDAVQALPAILDCTPDVVVVDLSLKRGSGLELIKDLAQHRPEVRTLVLSMHEEIGDVRRALHAGARGYVMKRASTGQVVDAIRQIHAGKIYAEPAVLAALAERMVGRSASDLFGPELLSDRELEVFRRLGKGQVTKQIADDLGLSVKTVQTYCMRIREKLLLEDGTALLRAAVQWIERHG